MRASDKRSTIMRIKNMAHAKERGGSVQKEYGRVLKAKDPVANVNSLNKRMPRPLAALTVLSQTCEEHTGNEEQRATERQKSSRQVARRPRPNLAPNARWGRKLTCFAQRSCCPDMQERGPASARVRYLELVLITRGSPSNVEHPSISKWVKLSAQCPRNHHIAGRNDQVLARALLGGTCDKQFPISPWGESGKRS